MCEKRQEEYCMYKMQSMQMQCHGEMKIVGSQDRNDEMKQHDAEMEMFEAR